MPRYLERTGQAWRVVVAVPRSLHHVLGTKLKHSLGRVSLAEAERLKWPHVTRFQSQIARAQGHQPTVQELEAEALAMARRMPNDALAAEATSYEIDDRAEEIAGAPVSIGQSGQAVHEPEREQQALHFHSVATGRTTPLDGLLSEWHAQTDRTDRTKLDDTRALRYLSEWCRANSRARTIQAIDRRAAGAFIGAAIQPSSFNQNRALSRKTANKYLSSLSAYWKWMKARGYVDDNPWNGQRLSQPQRQQEDQERPFTDEEISRLLAGRARQSYILDLIKIAALTGARIDAIACLKVKHCKDGFFSFKPQKRERGWRRVPIHSALLSLIDARTTGKADEDELFPELPVTARERSSRAVKAFQRFRLACGVDDTREGQRRSLVNFHSFRRWFITKAEQAGIEPHVIASVVGHQRPGMTLGLYSRGPSDEQLRACVEAVQLPSPPTA